MVTKSKETIAEYADRPPIAALAGLRLVPSCSSATAAPLPPIAAAEPVTAISGIPNGY